MEIKIQAETNKQISSRTTTRRKTQNWKRAKKEKSKKIKEN